MDGEIAICIIAMFFHIASEIVVFLKQKEVEGKSLRVTSWKRKI